MLKQLYTLKIANFIKIVTLGLFSLLLANCSDSSEQDTAPEQVTIEVADAEVVSEDAPAMTEAAVQEQAEATPEGLAEEVEDVGYINYDMVYGDPDAPVEIIEYASLTCNHCATFHNNVLPRIKEKYVDSGKVKIVMRSFLLNFVDARITVLTRCVSERRYFPFLDALFKRQTQWYSIPEYQRLQGLHDRQTASNMFVEGVFQEVSKLARQVGLNQTKIDACVNNTAIGEYLMAVQQDGVETYKVNSTPTIIVNGNRVNNDYTSIERVIEAELD